MKKLLKKVLIVLQSIKNAFFGMLNKIQTRFHSFILKHPELNRLKTLTSMQLRNSKKLLKPRSKKDKWLFLGLKFVVFFALMFLFKVLLGLIDSYVMGSVLMVLNRDHMAFILAIFVILSIVEIASSFTFSLYKSKDNMILLSYPVKASEVFVSKLLVRYIKELKKMIFFIVPLFVGYFLLGKLDLQGFFAFLYFVRLAFFALLLPLFIVLVSGVFSLLFVGLDYVFKRVPFLKLVTITLAIVGGFFLVLIFVDSLPQSLPLKELWFEIMQNVNSFIDEFVESEYLGNPGVIVDSLFFGLGIIGDEWAVMLIILGIIAVLVLLTIFVSFRLFFRLSSTVTEISSSKKYKTKTKQTKNIFWTFLKKELKTYMRSDDNVLTTFMYLIILPLLLFLLNRIFNVLDISDVGTVLIMCINLLISIVLLTASNVSSASALSREGSEFYLLKISPVDTKLICLAKIVINFALSTLAIVFVGVALSNVTFVSTQSTIFICLILLFVNTGHICWSFELDIMNPKIEQNKAGEAVIDDNSNVSTSIILGLVIAIIFTILGYFFFSKYPSDYLQTWIRLLLIAIVFCAVRIYMFIIKLKTYFDDISI